MKPLSGLILTALIALIFLSGCAQNPPESNSSSAPSYEQSLIDACVQACENSKAAGNNLENGPCLLNPMPQNGSWVCDVAHDPRQDIDNLVENRCPAFGKGETMHFIEVNPECYFIKKL
jgi:hypothetical protein